MAIRNLYSNLPGHLVEFKDGGLQLRESTTTTTTKSILILGTAVDGIVNEPVAIDINTLTKLYGSDVDETGAPNGATLVKAAKQAYKAGFDDIRCMRVTGSAAVATISKEGVVSTEEYVETKTAKAVGNTESTLVLTETPIEGTVVVKDGGTVVASTVLGKNLTVAENAYNSGTQNLTVTYDVEETQNETGDGVTTEYTITGITGTVTGVTVNEVPVEFSVQENKVVLNTAAGDSENIVIKGKKVVSQNLNLVAATQKIVLENAVKAKEDITVTADGQPVEFTLEEDKKTIAFEVKVTKGTTINVESTYVVETVENKTITIQTINGGDVYKDCHVSIEAGDAVDEKVLVLKKPASKKYTTSETDIRISLKDNKTFGAIVAAINNHALNNIFEAITETEEEVVTDTLTVVDFAGATSGLNPTNNELYEALVGIRDKEGYLTKQGAFQILENYNVDYVYVAGVYANSKLTGKYANKSFHYELALLCAVLTYRTKMTHGFIDWKPNTNTTLVGIQKYVAEILAYDNTHYIKDENGDEIVDENGNKMDIGWYTSLVVGPDVACVSDTLGNYYGSPAIAYAALNAKLKAQSAPTNKSLPGVKGMRFKLSNKQMEDITKKRMVVFKLKNEGNGSSSLPYVVDGCTSGAENSDYGRLSTVKVVTEVIDQIREVADPFIGEPNTIEQRNALAALISKRLSYLKEQGVIQYYDFEISATVEQTLLGQCSIALTLVAPQELRQITTVVALKATA